MGAQRFKFTVAMVAALLMANQVYAAGNTQAQNSNSEAIGISKIPEVHDSNVEIELHPRYDCTTPEPPTAEADGTDPKLIAPFGTSVAFGLAVDVGIALVSDALSKRQDKLQATYSGLHTAQVNNGIKCIEVLRKEVVAVGDNGEPTLEEAMKIQILVKPLKVKQAASNQVLGKIIAHRFALTSIANKNSATQKKVKKDRSEKHNFAISIGMVYVDASGDETTLSRNLTLVENVPLVSDLEEPIRIPGSIMIDDNPFAHLVEASELPPQYESAIFKPLPDILATTMTISITETDTRHKKATDVAELFENNKDSLESLLDGLID